MLKARLENYTNKVLPNVVDKAANDFQNQWPLCEAEALTHPVKPPAKDAKLLASYLKCAMKAAANLELVGEKVELTRKLNAPPRTSVDPGTKTMPSTFTSLTVAIRPTKIFMRSTLSNEEFYYGAIGATLFR